MYNRQELCLHLMESGCMCVSDNYADDGACLDDKDNIIDFTFSLSAVEDIVIELDNNVLLAQFKSRSGQVINLPEPKLGKRLSLYGYIKSLLANHKKLSEELNDCLESWVKVFKYGYTYANFRKAVFNNIAASYTVVLSHNLHDLTGADEADCFSISLNFLKNSLVIYTFCSEIVLSKEQVNLSDFFSCNTFEDYLAHYSYLPTVATYRRKKVIDSIIG